MGRPKKQEAKGEAVRMYIPRTDEWIGETGGEREVAIAALQEAATHFVYHGRVYEVDLEYKPIDGGE